MSQIPFDMATVLDLLGAPTGTLQAYEQTGTLNVNGTMTFGAAQNTRDVDGIVLTADPQALELIAPGSAESGGIVVQTQETLSWVTAASAVQSFVIYQGATWRVVSSGMTGTNANFNNYTCVRYWPSGTDRSNLA